MVAFFLCEELFMYVELLEYGSIVEMGEIQNNKRGIK